MSVLKPILNKTEYEIESIGHNQTYIRLGGKQSYFVPNVNLSFRCHSSLEYFWLNINDEDLQTHDVSESIVNRKLGVTKGDITATFEIDKEKDSRLKIERIYLTKPKKPVKYKLTYSSGLRFCYQSSLTEEEIALGRNRSDEVAGSYAVYCDRTGDYSALDGPNFKAGKVLHIYAPFWIDANGKQIKTSQEIINDYLIIQLPDDTWLNNARYPIKLDPDLGNNGTPASSWSLQQNWRASHDTTDASGGTTTDIYMYVASGADGSRYAELSVYSDDVGNNRPEAEMAAAGETTITPSNGYTGWISGAYVATLTASTKYWLCGWGNSISLNIGYDDDVANRECNHASGSTSISDPWPDTGNSNSTAYWGIYATYGADVQFLTRNIAYRILNTIERDTGWKLLVAASTDIAYRILNAINRDTAAKILTAKDQDSAYRILNAITRDTASKIFSSLDRNSSWVIMTKVERDISWVIINRLDRNMAWDILNTKDQHTAWGMLTQISEDTSWKVFTVTDQDLAWDILTYLEQDTGWQLFDAVSLDTAWDVFSDIVPEPIKIFMAEQRTFIFNAEYRTFIFNAEQRTFIFFA